MTCFQRIIIAILGTAMVLLTIYACSTSHASLPTGAGWDRLSSIAGLCRTEVPGGWLVVVDRDRCLVFIPDASHTWDAE